MTAADHEQSFYAEIFGRLVLAGIGLLETSTIYFKTCGHRHWQTSVSS